MFSTLLVTSDGIMA